MDENSDNEHVISSDEYSDEVDYDDALMIGAIRGQDQNIKPNNYGSQDEQSDWRIDQKQKQLSSLIRRNKISVIYKKKSIKWLNNKRQRERYKKQLYFNAKTVNMAQIERPALSLSQKQHLSESIKTDDQYIHDVINIEEKETSFNLKSNKDELKEVKNTTQNTIPLLSAHQTNQIAKITPKQDGGEQITISEEEENIHDIEQLKETNKQTKEIPGKRPRSKSPPSVLDQTNDMNVKCSEKKFKSDSSQFYAGINDMFPNFDKIATNHINNITNSCPKNVDEKMRSLSIEIETLNEILHAKEKELNRLSHLKMVKEEIYFRLDRKRHNLLSRESFSDKRHQYTSHDLKELEMSLSDKNETAESSYSSKTIQKLIENRANMNADDLKREKNNTNRLHSLLVSQNMLHSTELPVNSYLNRSDKKVDMGLTTNLSNENSNYLNGERSTTSMGRLGEFREQNPDLFPRVDKRLKLSDVNAKKFEKHSRSEFFPLPNSVNEISITPIGHTNKLPVSLENVRLAGDRCIKSKIKANLNGKYPARNIQYPLCQECKAKESRFVCAGCGNQWYCSKTCQITAWDVHSEICTE